jgi:hypothetical protein
MTIIEIIMLEQSPGVYSKLIQHFSFDIINSYDIPVLRLEIDPELVVLIYRFNMEVQPRETLLDNIFPHIKSIIVLTGGEDLQNLVFPENLVERLSEYFNRIPTIIAVPESNGGILKVPAYIEEHGLYLGPGNRMVFFNEESRESVQRVWKLTLVGLPQ